MTFGDIDSKSQLSAIARCPVFHIPDDGCGTGSSGTNSLDECRDDGAEGEEGDLVSSLRPTAACVDRRAENTVPRSNCK